MALAVKNLPASAEETGSIPGLERSPGEGNGNPSSGLSRKSYGQTSLAGYSPWSHKRVRHNLATKQKQLELPFLRRRKPIVLY